MTLAARCLPLVCAPLVLAFCTSNTPATSGPATAAMVKGAHMVEGVHDSMGTQVHLTAWTADDATAQSAFGAVFQEFDRLDEMMSVWKNGSDVARLNGAAGEHPVAVSAEVRETLNIAHQVSEWTDGKFDVTFGALSGLWKFDYQDQDNTVPDRREVLKRLPLVNYRDLIVDDRAGTAFLKRKGMSANLGGIGKGYAVDRAVAILRRRGLSDFMIQAGGDLYVAGRRGDRPWRLGIRDPRGPATSSFATMDVSDSAFSTSGDYEHFFMKDGRRYHHILDLSVGEPAPLCRSVTLVTRQAVIADALAKGVFILGPEAGLALVERLPHVGSVIVSSKNDVMISSGLKNSLVLLAPPTDAP